MTLAEALAGAGGAVSAIMGLGGLIRPRWAQIVTRLQPDPARPGGAAEFRASFGGLFLGLGLAMLAALWAGNGVTGASLVAGLAWLLLALGRAVSMALDGTATRYNALSAAFEAAIGAMLLAPFIAHFRTDEA